MNVMEHETSAKLSTTEASQSRLEEGTEKGIDLSGESFETETDLKELAQHWKETVEKGKWYLKKGKYINLFQHGLWDGAFFSSIVTLFTMLVGHHLLMKGLVESQTIFNLIVSIMPLSFLGWLGVTSYKEHKDCNMIREAIPRIEETIPKLAEEE